MRHILTSYSQVCKGKKNPASSRSYYFRPGPWPVWAPTRLIAVIVLYFLTGCSTAPDPIRFGADVCEYCHMTIVDEQHAALFVTQKGRTYKFDAIECMINELKTVDQNSIGQYLISDYAKPGTMVSAPTASFLISPEIPSPMGAFLSGFSNPSSAGQILGDRPGELFDWEEIQAYFENTQGVLPHQ